MQTLKLADDLFPKVIAGTKRGTIRLGKRDIVPGPMWLERTSGTGNPIMVDVARVSYAAAEDLTADDASADGYPSVGELLTDLLRFYPDMQGSDIVTIVTFSPATPAQE